MARRSRSWLFLHLMAILVCYFVSLDWRGGCALNTGLRVRQALIHHHQPTAGVHLTIRIFATPVPSPEFCRPATANLFQLRQGGVPSGQEADMVDSQRGRSVAACNWLLLRCCCCFPSAWQEVNKTIAPTGVRVESNGGGGSEICR